MTPLRFILQSLFYSPPKQRAKDLEGAGGVRAFFPEGVLGEEKLHDPHGRFKYERGNSFELESRRPRVLKNVLRFCHFLPAAVGPQNTSR